MRSKFSIAGHPLHPLLVALPIGLFAWAWVCDLVFIANDDKMWYDLSFWTGIAAVVTALVAALPGIGDYLTLAMKSDARGMATAHGLLNVTIVVLYFVAALMMMNEGALDGGDRTAVVVLHTIGVGLLLLSGWLGGEMVFRHHLAMVPDTAALASEEERQHERQTDGRQVPGTRRT